MSDHRDGGGLPIVGILAALLILPVGAWVFLAASPAPRAVPGAPLPATSTATAASSIESGSALEQAEIEDSVEAEPEASSSNEAPNEEVVPGESAEADSE